MVDNFKIRIVVLKQLLKLDCFYEEIPRNFTDKNYYIAKKDWTLIRTSLESAFFSKVFWGVGKLFGPFLVQGMILEASLTILKMISKALGWSVNCLVGCFQY